MGKFSYERSQLGKGTSEEGARLEKGKDGKGASGDGARLTKGAAGEGQGWKGHDFSRAIKTRETYRLQPLRFALRPQRLPRS
jgi:hypothetical protein